LRKKNRIDPRPTTYIQNTARFALQTLADSLFASFKYSATEQMVKQPQQGIRLAINRIELFRREMKIGLYFLVSFFHSIPREYKKNPWLKGVKPYQG